ncbi:MAG: HAD-IC family P-type ATPase, partial [Actinomycetia bacterium]|nr:HAD-IC family P-type ATPase [Actinomycetes bacterium]
AGKTVVFLGTEKKLIAALALADQIRPNTAEALSALQGMGQNHLIMLTGDNEATAANIAKGLGIDAFHAELLPEDKVGLIKSLEKRYGSVVMVGDGVNDAPALASATIGIAMGAAGTDVALETADIALMSDDISKVPEAIKLSRRTMRIIQQNIIFSLGVVVLLVAATFSGYLNLTLGVVGHEGSALIVIANGMRLLKQ